MLEYLAAHLAGSLAADAVRFRQEEKAAAKARADFEDKWDFSTSEMIVDSVAGKDIAEFGDILRSMGSACTILDDMGFCEGVGLSGMTFKGIFLDDAEKFMLCAAMSDGPVNADEAAIIGTLAGKPRDLAYWRGRAVELGVSEPYHRGGQTLYFQIACQMADFLGTDVAEAARMLYEKLGCAVIQADRRVSQAEIDAIEGGLNAIDRWRM